ncbi:MAG: hypothetical protein QOE63_783 [Acidimicrobiaceae bacterium]|jgi:hypothetical protein
MGFLDKAKKLAEQAKEMAEGALADAKQRQASQSSAPVATGSAPAEYGTPYVPGMLGRAGWRERGLTDPAAIVPIKDRDRLGVPRSTRSAIVEEPFGMGRRWVSGDRSIGVFYRLYPEQQTWQGAADDGLVLVPVGGGEHAAMLELRGFDAGAQAELTQIAAGNL